MKNYASAVIFAILFTLVSCSSSTSFFFNPNAPSFKYEKDHYNAIEGRCIEYSPRLVITVRAITIGAASTKYWDFSVKDSSGEERISEM